MSDLPSERAILVARLPQARAWEPIIVTTLRRYMRRRAPQSLLHRLAGGPAHFRALVVAWDLDDRALALQGEAAELPGELGVRLSAGERRIALRQLAAELKRDGKGLPGQTRLGRFFGVSRQMIGEDLERSGLAP